MQKKKVFAVSQVDDDPSVYVVFTFIERDTDSKTFVPFER